MTNQASVAPENHVVGNRDQQTAPGDDSQQSFPSNNAPTDDHTIHTTLLSTVSFSRRPESHWKLLYAGVVAGTTVLGTLGLLAPFVGSRSPLPYMATPGHKVRRALAVTLTLPLRSEKSRTTPSMATTAAAAAAATKRANPLPSHRPSYPLPNLHQANLPKTFLDLGSGDGEAVYQALQAGYNRAIGIELNFTLYLISQLRRCFFWSREERQRSHFVCGDFFSYPHFDQADTIMIFGIQQTSFLTRVSQTIQQEVARRKRNRDDQRLPLFVLAYRFPLPVQSTSNDGDQKNEMRKKDGSAIQTLVESDTWGSGGVSGLFSGELIYEEEEMRIYQSK